MQIRELQETYQNIAKLIPAVETASNAEKIIGFYTSKIEQEGKWEKLKQWIEYLAQKDAVQAVLAINKLRRTTEEKKEELKKILLSQIEKQSESKDKIYELMLIFLYLNEFDKAHDLYKNMKNPEKVDIEKEIDPILNTVEDIKEYRTISKKIQYLIKENLNLLNELGLSKSRAEYRVKINEAANIRPVIQFLEYHLYKIIRKSNEKMLQERQDLVLYIMELETRT